ncbi:MAG: helix-turn-helix domain-containing protein [Panacagrimonas sp.]
MSLLEPMDNCDPYPISHWSRTPVADAGAFLQRSRSVRLDKALAVIRQRIEEPDLSPDAIASAVHMSRRALYLLFEEHGLKPQQAIRDQRLECCRQTLRDPRHQHRKITDIALDFGFLHASTLSRQFASRYGVSPQQLRNASLGRRGTAAPNAHTRSITSAIPCPTPMHIVHSA